MSAKTFNEVYGQTIKEFHPHILKQDTTRYEVDIYDENFTIDKKNKKINLALAFNFAFTDSPLIEEEEEQIKYLLDEFLFKVISNSNEKSYNFLMDMLSCYAHRKQTNAILILVGEGGTGKSKFIELLQALFGSSCKMMTDQVMSGQDMFNSSMIGTSIGYIEETNGKGESNYTDIQRTLKRLSTSKYITCRKMQTDAFDVLNIINFVVVTNFIKDTRRPTGGCNFFQIFKTQVPGPKSAFLDHLAGRRSTGRLGSACRRSNQRQRPLSIPRPLAP